MKTFIQDGKILPLVITHPVAPVSGEAVRFGYMTGVAVAGLGASGVAATETLTKLDWGVYNLSVAPVDGNGNSAIAAGDPIYFVDGDTPHLSKKSSGYFFGFAIGANAAVDGTVAAIDVLHVPAPGLGTTPADASVTTAKLVDANVTAAKLAEAVATITAKVSCTNAQLKGLRAAPKTLVAAQAGKVLQFVSAVLELKAGANVLSESDDNLAVKYTNGAGAAVSETIECTNFIDQAANTITQTIAKKDAIVAAASAINQALVLHNTGDGEFGGNAAADATLDIFVTYRVLTITA